MKIGIIGLGLMGASFAKAWSSNHYIIGYDSDHSVIKKAQKDGVIHQAATSSSNVIESADVLFICLYPQATKDLIVEHQSEFRAGMIVCDIAGVKSIYQGLVAPAGVEYVWTHPIAGRALSGYAALNTQMFQGANFIITPTTDTQEQAIQTIATLAKECGFKTITHMSMADHDAKIAYTSQLTHAIAVSLMNTATDDSFLPIIGDSFRDLTRIARINDVMWSELFLLNKTELVEQMQLFQRRFDALLQAVMNDDRSAIQTIMQTSKQKRELLP
jgi:prephenate dehydrogenase